jgi:hypothetical protein
MLQNAEFFNREAKYLKGQSYEKGCEIIVWDVSFWSKLWFADSF